MRETTLTGRFLQLSQAAHLQAWRQVRTAVTQQQTVAQVYHAAGGQRLGPLSPSQQQNEQTNTAGVLAVVPHLPAFR